MQNHPEKLRALLETTKAITAELDLNKVLNLILQRGKELTNADTGALLLVDKDQKLWTKKLIGPHKEEEYRYTIDEGITGWVARNKEPLLVPDVSSKDIYIEWTPETKSELAVPMLYGKKLIGVLNVESFHLGAFEKSDCELLTALAGHAAIAIENARLYEEIHKQVKIVDSLNKVGAKITANIEQIPIMREIAKGLNEIVEADIPLVYLYDQEKDEFTDIYYGDVSEEWTKCVPREEGAGVKAIKEKQIVVFHEDDEETPGISTFAKKKGVKTTIAIPLIYWFSIDAEFEDDMNESSISEKMKNIFKAKGFAVSGNASVTKEKENKWVITDEEKNFIVRNEYGMLNIYPPTFGDVAIGAMYLHFLGEKHYLEDEEEKELLQLAKRTRTIVKDTMEEIGFYPGSGKKRDELKEKISEKIDEEKIAETIDKLTKADILLMYLCEMEETKYNLMHIIFARLSREWGANCRPRKEGAGKTAIESEVLVTAYENPDESYPKKGLDINPYPKQKGAKTTAAYPLIFQDKKLGVFFMHFLERHEFTGEEKKAIHALGTHAAIALERAKTYRRLRELADVERDVTSNLSLKITAKHIAEAIERIIGGGIPNIFLYDSRKKTFDFLACSGEKDEVFLGKFAPREDGLGARVIEKVKKGEEPDYIIIEDVQKDPKNQNPSPTAKDYVIKTSACFPLKFGNRPLGALYLHFKETHHFSEDEIRVFTHFADQTAIAIENARRYEALEKAREEVEAVTTIAWLGIVSSTWQHKIVQKIFAIEIRIATIESYLSETNCYSDEVKATLEAIKQDVQEAKGVQPEFPHGDVMTSVNINGVITDSLKRHKTRITDKGIKVKLDLDEEIPSVKASYDWLEVVFDILIHNAIRAMTDEGELTFISKVEEDKINVEVTDTGSGIPESIQRQFFNERIAGTQGFGVGLLLAKIILRRYRGDIKLSSTGPSGTTFALILPLEEN